MEHTCFGGQRQGSTFKKKTLKNVNGFEKLLSIELPADRKLNQKLRRSSKENHQFQSKYG